MEYTIRTKAEFNAETHRHVFGDFSWMSDIEPSLFFDKEVAGKILRWANADDGSDRYLVKYFPKEYWQRRDCILDAVSSKVSRFFCRLHFPFIIANVYGQMGQKRPSTADFSAMKSQSKKTGVYELPSNCRPAL